MSGDSHARAYWDATAGSYRRSNRISCRDFHYGPLLPGDAELQLLPGDVKGRHCLEMGCGGAQNSIFLASRGARCCAFDLSAEQLASARNHAAAAAVRINLLQADMACPGLSAAPTFDLIHSTFALGFCDAPDAALRAATAMLRPGGRLLLTVAHPLFAAEWLEVDADETGIFLPDYFSPPDDCRPVPDAAGVVRCRTRPLSHTVECLAACGLQLLRLLEPVPLPVDRMSETEIASRVPYDSRAWRSLLPRMQRIPVAVVMLAQLPR